MRGLLSEPRSYEVTATSNVANITIVEPSLAAGLTYCTSCANSIGPELAAVNRLLEPFQCTRSVHLCLEPGWNTCKHARLVACRHVETTRHSCGTV